MEDLRQEILKSYEASKNYEALKAAEYRKNYEARRAADALQEAKLRALQDALSNYDNFRYVDLKDFIDPDNQNWKEYKYYAPDLSTYLMGPPTQGYINAGTPVGMFIQQIRDAKNIDDVNKQFKLWNSYKPLNSYDNGRSYIRYFIPGFATRRIDYGGSRPVQTTAGGTGGAQGVVTVGGAQGTKTGNTGGISTGGGTASTQGMKAGGTGTGGMQTGNSSGTYASSGVPKGGTKTIGYGYDPNPGGASLAFTLRNEPEQVQRAALSAKWNLENGRSGSTYASPGISTGGTYATGVGIKDANGNVLTNPGGDWEYQYALKNPQYGLGMMGKMSDAQRNYLQAVSDDMGYNYNFKGATRFV